MALRVAVSRGRGVVARYAAAGATNSRAHRCGGARFSSGEGALAVVAAPEPPAARTPLGVAAPEMRPREVRRVCCARTMRGLAEGWVVVRVVF